MDAASPLSRDAKLQAILDSKAEHAKTIPLYRAVAWRWHVDRDPRVRFQMAVRLPPDSIELAAMMADADATIAAMAYDRSALADYERACASQFWQIRQVGVAKTESVELVRAARHDENAIVRATAERRLYGKKGRCFSGALQRVV